MTEIDEQTDQCGEQQTAEDEVSADRKPTAPEVLEWRRDDVFLPETDGNTEEFPSLRNISANGVQDAAQPTSPVGGLDGLDHGIVGVVLTMPHGAAHSRVASRTRLSAALPESDRNAAAACRPATKPLHDRRDDPGRVDL